MKPAIKYAIYAATVCILAVAVILVGNKLSSKSFLYGRYGTTPSSDHGRKWRIAYYEGGPYINYPANLKAIAEGLAELGWIKIPDIPFEEGQIDAKAMWAFLSKNTVSDYLEFAPEAFLSAGWDDLQRERNKAEAIKRFNSGNIDLILAFGTWAGIDLSSKLYSVPTLVISTSDAIQSKIIWRNNVSKTGHVYARVDPYRYMRQIMLFNEVFGFKRLGVVYENTLEGRAYAALEDIRQVAKERNFEIVLCEAPFSNVTREESTGRIIACHKELAPKIDALFMTVHRGVDAARMDEILAPLVEYRIPTWSQRGELEVKAGVLLSISRGIFKDVGRYHAEVMAKVLNGAKPVNIDMEFHDPKKIAINLDAAAKIGYVPSPEVISIADKVYGRANRKQRAI